jgi:acyl carrier protein
MIPAFFVPLASLPLTNHGKVDRAALAQIDVNPKQTIPPAELAGNQLERTLVELWQRVLKVSNVGLDDNFFDLGGDSLLLVAVHSNLQKILKIEIALTDLFEFATVRKLAQHLGHAESVTASLAEVQDRAQQQRESFKRSRGRRPGGDS